MHRRLGISGNVDEIGNEVLSDQGSPSELQEAPDRSNGGEKKRGRPRTKLLPVKGKEKIIPREALSTKLYRQGEIVTMYEAYYNRKLGTLNMTQEQEKTAENVKKTFSDLVTAPFMPKENGREIWPYTLSEVDLCKLAWAIHIKQEEIVVPRWVKIEL